jgi:threonine-phosphate decarboxylase
MPGIRFGYGIATESLIDTLQTVRQPWSINSLASYATLAAFKDTEFIENTKRTIAKERTQFAEMLSEIGGLHVFPSVTNFLLVKILNKKVTAAMLKEELSKEGILIRNCSTFMGLDDRYFRVTVRAFRENLVLVKAVKKALKIVD